MLGFCPLASGSKGNCIFLGSQQTRILIDAGLSLSLTEKRLAEIGVDLKTIEAVLITHEHVDHIQGLLPLIKKLQIPVLANAETAKGIYSLLSERPRFKIFTTAEPFTFADMEVLPFSVPHDTLDPVGFSIRIGDLKLGFCTDLGHVTSLIRKALENSDYLYLEANHQPSMVHACNRPMMYKQRVLGRQGHLSNQDCAELLVALHHEKLKHVHLAHLSSECNNPELALKIMQEALLLKGKSVDLSIAFQEKISKMILF